MDTAVPPTLTPSATPLPATPTPIPPTQTPTATATPSPTATPDFSCPQPGGNATLETSLDFPEFSEKLVAYLNQVGTIEQLPEQLEALNIEYDIFPVDMNDDDALEFVLNVAIPPEGEMAFPGDRGTAILQCRNGSYEVIFDIWSGIYRFFRYTFSDDVDNDGNQDVIIVGGFAGSACDLEPKVFIWSESEIVDASPDHRELALGCSHEDMVLTEDIDGDGAKELIISGWTVGHLDYAPPRTITQTFTLQNGTYHLQTTEFGPPEYLVHLLDDAQRVLDSSDLVMAAQLYETIAEEQSLPTVFSDYIGPPQAATERGIEPDYPQEYQQAFALFRLAALQTVLGNTTEADWALTQLKERFPQGTPGAEFISLTLLLVNSLQQGDTPESACEAVAQEIEQTYPKLGAHYYWGWNIAWYQNETICPFTEPFYD
ncbi:MAG: hypothetical protein KC445_03205 [Anaerolineales bacterium]|nr:hypothetical protein [Anaerolineales bacterium]